MASFVKMKIDIRKKILLMAEKEDLILQKVVSKMCLDTGFKARTVENIVEMMDDMGEIVVKDGIISLKTSEKDGKVIKNLGK